jgi:hypothetical protein
LVSGPEPYSSGLYLRLMRNNSRQNDPDLLYAVDDPFGMPVKEQIEMLWFECINKSYIEQNERNACLFWLMEKPYSKLKS